MNHSFQRIEAEISTLESEIIKYSPQQTSGPIISIQPNKATPQSDFPPATPSRELKRKSLPALWMIYLDPCRHLRKRNGIVDSQLTQINKFTLDQQII